MKHSPLCFERIFICCEAVMTNNERLQHLCISSIVEVVTQLIARMPAVMETEKIVQLHKHKELSAHGFSLFSSSLALVMISVGDSYWSEEECRLGAASYLYYGGVFSLCVNILGLTTALAKYLALKVIIIINVSS